MRATPMIVDHQTLRELAVLSDVDEQGGLLALLDHTATRGGHECLRRRLREPLSDRSELCATQEAVRYLMTQPRSSWVPVRQQTFDGADWYLKSRYSGVSSKSALGQAVESYWVRFRVPEMHKTLVGGLSALQSIVASIAALTALRPPDQCPPLLDGMLDVLRRTLAAAPEIAMLARSRPVSMLRAPTVFSLDVALREMHRTDMRQAIDILYELDALMSLAEATRRHGWIMPEIADGDRTRLEFEGLYHPFVNHAIRNSITLDGHGRVAFITGPNMAGKSTFLKACGLAVLLAHLGTGVPADRMVFTPVERLMSSLNAEDSARLGYSSFVGEIRRVREIVAPLVKGSTTVALLDEPFKTTNVLDARDATRALVHALASSSSCITLIASHLADLGPELDGQNGVQLVHFAGRLHDGEPVFDFRLRPGVSDQRLGMILLQKTGLLRILTELSEPPRSHTS
jgi:DNA mismatch repair ATPase MutS